MRQHRAAAMLAAALAVVSCGRTTDWTRFDTPSVQSSITTLLEAGRRYGEYASTDRARAVDDAVQYLLAQECCDTAGMTPDSSVWVWYRNGLVATVIRPRHGHPALTRRRGGDIHAAGGDVAGPYYILSPFQKHWNNPGGDGDSDYADELNTLLDKTLGPNAEPNFYKDDEVTVEVIRRAISSGFLYWSGHGEQVPLPSGDTVTGLVAGEFWDAQTGTARVFQLREAGYRFADQGGLGAHLGLGELDDEVYIQVLPGFFRDFGNFVAAGASPRDRSIVYLSCCFGDGMREAAMARGADVFLGWTNSPWSVEARDIDSAFFTRACSTLTLGEALQGVQRTSDKAYLSFAGDSNAMIRCRCTLMVDGTPERFYLLFASGESPTTIAAQDGVPTPAQVTVVFPGSVGEYTTAQTEDAMVLWFDVPAGRNYMAANGLRGVSGTISVERYDDAIIEGTFSGTLGWWEPGHDPSEDPPDATVETAEGYFKYSGER